MRSLLVLASFSTVAALTGCASSGAFSPSSTAAVAAAGIKGSVHAGSHAIAGAHVYLMKANNTGYGQPSVSLLNSSTGTSVDSVGGYVVTDSNGNFTIPDTYTCSGADQAYLYVVGGNAGSGTNSASGLLAAIGNCPTVTFSGVTNVLVNEISTVAATYAMAGFANDVTHVSTSGSPLAQTGLANAFANAFQFYSPATGLALNYTPAGNGQVPYQAVNTLADVISSCIQSSGPGSYACGTLLTNAPTDLTNNVYPTDTAGAAMNIAHHPGANVSALYALAAPNAPYGPSLPVAPNDFTLGINFIGGGLNNPYAVAIDAFGNAWVANLGNSTVSKLSPLGEALSPAGGYVNGSPVGPVGITVDLSDNTWIVNAITSSVTKYTSSGALLSPLPSGYTGGGIAAPQAIATDALGSVWTANYPGSVSKFSSGGLAISPYTGYSGGGISGPVAIAIDASGAAWVANTSGNPSSVTKLSSAGAAISPPTGFIGGGIANPFSIAIDAQGSAWVANFGGNSVSKLSNNGTPVSPATGWVGGGLSLPFSIAVDGAGNAWVANSGAFSISEISNSGTMISPATGYTGGLLNGPQAIAIDGSGDVWIANGDDITMTEVIGAAAPVITPLVTGIKNNTLGTRP